MAINELVRLDTLNAASPGNQGHGTTPTLERAWIVTCKGHGVCAWRNRSATGHKHEADRAAMLKGESPTRSATATRGTIAIKLMY